MIGDNDFTLADTDASPVTGAVTATVAASDPEGKKLTYSLTSGPAVGSLVFNKTTGVFTYTPTAAQRIQAALPGGVTPASFTVTVSDGKTKVVAPVSVAIEPTQLTDIGALPAGEGALGLAVTNTRAYITNRDAGTVTVIDTISGAFVEAIDVDDLPDGIAVSRDGTKVYVASQATNTVSVINAATNTVTSHIQLGGRTPQLMAISPDGKTLYVTTTSYDDDGFVTGSTITKISTTTNKVSGTVKNVGLVPYGITVSPDGKKVYVISELDSDGDYRSGVFVFSSTSSTAKRLTGVGDRPSR